MTDKSDKPEDADRVQMAASLCMTKLREILNNMNGTTNEDFGLACLFTFKGNTYCFNNMQATELAGMFSGIMLKMVNTGELKSKGAVIVSLENGEKIH